MKARSAAERRRLTKQLDAAVCHVSTSLVSHISVNQTAQPGIQMWGGREREGEGEREREKAAFQVRTPGLTYRICIYA